jgi:hypothetical protein
VEDDIHGILFIMIFLSNPAPGWAAGNTDTWSWSSAAHTIAIAHLMLHNGLVWFQNMVVE